MGEYSPLPIPYELQSTARKLRKTFLEEFNRDPAAKWGGPIVRDGVSYSIDDGGSHTFVTEKTPQDIARVRIRDAAPPGTSIAYVRVSRKDLSVTEFYEGTPVATQKAIEMLTRIRGN